MRLLSWNWSQARPTDFMTRQSRIGKVYRLAGEVAGGTEAMPERAIADNLGLHFVVSERRPIVSR